MKNFKELANYDLLAKVVMIKTEYMGRQGAVYDDYRGQFFWHINDVNCTDWDARYFFENGELAPGEESMCKILLSNNLKNASKGKFPADSQFCIREGSRVVAVGRVIESKVKNA
ncbi:hypothetical protein [Gayadomonas joobiniege]|uniref:EF-Tu C-terminal domain-related protein n=1 Tax=Gayadomonas joobiniege TaxID=1234606 RepID=UPI0003733223|nr:hypothetical protein [Gayadomonas joobiniege]